MSAEYQLTGEQDNPVPTSAQLAPKVNPYLRKWTCIQCHFSNDSLKIVCLNCRWMKTSPGRGREAGESGGEAAGAKESKRAKAAVDASLSVDAGVSAVCASCKSPIVAEGAETPAKATGVEPKRLDFGAEARREEGRAPPSAEPAPSSLFGKFKAQTSKWTCDTCLIPNEDTSDKCVCCSTAKPGPKPAATTAAAAAAPETTTLFKKMAQSSSKWTCDTCLVSNAEVNEKCACCMTARPNSKPVEKTAATSSSPPSSSSSLSFPSLAPQSKPSPFASAAGKWTCDTCLIGNDALTPKCVCCQTDRPGLKPAVPQLPKTDIFTAQETPTIKFGSSNPAASTVTAAPVTFGTSQFKFESFKPTEAAAPAFKFGSDLFKAPATSGAPTPDQPAKKPAFSFGSLAASQETTSSLFKFGQPTAQSVVEPKPTATLPTKAPETGQNLSTSSFLSTLSTLAGPPKSTGESSLFSTASSFPAFKAFGEVTTATTAVTARPEESVPAFKFGETTATTTARDATAKASSFSFGSATTTTAATATTTPAANTFSLFPQSDSTAKQSNDGKPLLFGSTGGFGVFAKPPQTEQPPAQPPSLGASFFNLSEAPKPASTTASLFGGSAQATSGTPKLTFGNLSGGASSLFGSKPADNKPSVPLFGQSNTAGSTLTTGGLFSNLNQQQISTTSTTTTTATPSFNFFSTPPSTNSTPAVTAANTTPSLFSTQTLTPNSASMQTNSNSSPFQFTPLTFNNQQQTNQFVPNLAPPVINFTGTNSSGFVFSGSSDQPTTDLVAQRRRAKAVRRQR